MTNIVPQLLDWYDREQRSLPWRQPGVTPWQILVSEFMLQQTPVARVEPVWVAWVARWPTPSATAAASAADVLRAWGKLGYPRRAKRLHECAAVIAELFDDVVPSDVGTLLTLPGIGAYTARAVACFAFGKRVPVVDTNVRRVVARVVHGRADSPASVRDLDDVAALLPNDADAPRFSAHHKREPGLVQLTERFLEITLGLTRSTLLAPDAGTRIAMRAHELQSKRGDSPLDVPGVRTSLLHPHPLEIWMQDTDDRQIRDLITAYSHLADHGRGDDLVDLVFAEDAVVNYGFGEISGREALLQLFSHKAISASFQGTAHVIGNQIVRIDGDEARSHSYVTAWHWLQETRSQGDQRAAEVVLVLTYDDKLRRTPKGWRISNRYVCRVGPGGIVAGEVATDSALGVIVNGITARLGTTERPLLM
jgi:endonuclease III